MTTVYDQYGRRRSYDTVDEGAVEAVRLICTPCSRPNNVPARRGRCGTCRQPVWIARAQVMKVPADAVPMCIPCALNDPLARAYIPPEMLDALIQEYINP